MFWVTFDFECTYIKKCVWLFCCNTNSFREPKLSMPFCSIALSDNYSIIKVFSWNGWCYSSLQQKKNILEVSVFLWGFPFDIYYSSLALKIAPSLGQGVLLAPLPKYLQLVDYWCNNKLCDIKKQIILNNWKTKWNENV